MPHPRKLYGNVFNPIANMGKMLRIPVWWLLVFWFGNPWGAYAQQVFSIAPQAIQSALLKLRSAGIDVVFSTQTVGQQQTSCRYAGQNPADALSCILKGSNLVAKSTAKPGQWLITARAEVPRVMAAATRSEANAPLETRVRMNLRGLVLDDATGLALAGANVVVAGMPRGATSDLDGKWTIEGLWTGVYAIRISFIGYQTVVQNVSPQSGLISVRLKIDAEQVANLEVQSNRAEAQNERTTPGMLTLSSRQLSENTAYRAHEDLFSVLDGMPNIGRTAEGNGNIIVRGADDNLNMYLLDGVPLYTPGRSFGGFAIPQTDVLEGITLYRGMMPVAFGGRLSSILDAEVKSGRGGNASFTGGASQQSNRFIAELPIRANLSMMVSARLSQPEAVRSVTSLAMQGKQGLAELDAHYRFGDGTVKAVWQLNPAHQLSALGYWGADRLGATGAEGLFTNVDVLKPFDKQFTGTLNYGWHSGLAGLQHQFLPNDHLLIQSKVYTSGYQLDEMNEVLILPNQDEDDRGGNNGDANKLRHDRPVQNLITLVQPQRIRANYASSLTEYGVRSEAHYTQGLHHVNAGFSHTRYDSQSELSHIETENGQQANRLKPQNSVETVFFVDDNLQWQHMELRPGLRLGKFDQYTFVSPQFFARFAPTHQWSIKGGVGTNQQHIQWLRDRFGCVYETGTGQCTDVGRVYVRPSNGVQGSIGVEHRSAKGYAFQTEAYTRSFHNVLVANRPYRVRDGLDEPVIGMRGEGEIYVPGHNQAYGIETSFQLNRKTWQTSVAYTYSRSFYTFNQLGRSVKMPARYDAPHGLDAVLRWTHNGWFAGLNLELHSGYPTQAQGQTVMELLQPNLPRKATMGAIQVDRLPLYRRVDLTTGYAWKNSHVHGEVTFQLFNATNSENYIDRVYSQSTPGVYINGSKMQPNLNIKLTLPR